MTKNHIRYKKKYVVVDGVKYAPYRLTVNFDETSGGLMSKVIALAKRNTGTLSPDSREALEYDWSDSLEFDFFTEKGVAQFVKKAEKRYAVSHGLYVYVEKAEVSLSYEEVEVGSL